jgi:dihydrolipoamide dehydrogenase
LEDKYDLLIIGAGAAGSSAVSALDKTGKRIALIERNILGGTCLNYGCDPTKTLLHIANLLYQARHSKRFGLRISEASFDWQEVRQRVQQVITQLRGGPIDEAEAKLRHEGIDLIHGEASLISPHEVSVSGKTFYAQRILIATGSQTVIPPVEGLQETGYITNIQAVSLPHLPRRLAIVGGGAIGVEFAQLFHRFGVEVVVLERSPIIVDKEDRELADKLCALLSQEGIRLKTNTELKRARKEPDGKHLTISSGEKGEMELVVDEILMAVGRRPSFEALQLDKAGVQTTKKGIQVDETLRTTVPHIWAAGDVASPYQFTHIASAQGKLVAHNAFADRPQRFDDRAISWVTFTHPALAHLGKTEEQLKQEGTPYKVARFSMNENERAVTLGETDGMIKVLCDPEGKILGAHVLADHAGEIISSLVVAMRNGLTVGQIASSILPYPTLSEALTAVAGTLQEQAGSEQTG